MATSGYVPNIHHPDMMRSILEQIVDTGDVIGAAGPGRTILAVTVDNWLIDELAALGSDVADREPEDVDDKHLRRARYSRQEIWCPTGSDRAPGAAYLAGSRTETAARVLLAVSAAAYWPPENRGQSRASPALTSASAMSWPSR